MIEMINNIRWAFEKIVQDLDWMDDTTKKRTLYKSQQIKTFIGYPELVNDTSQLDDYYSEVIPSILKRYTYYYSILIFNDCSV